MLIDILSTYQFGDFDYHALINPGQSHPYLMSQESPTKEQIWNLFYKISSTVTSFLNSRDLWVLSASQDQGTLPSTEIGRERVVSAGLWLCSPGSQFNASLPRVSSPLSDTMHPLQPPLVVLPWSASSQLCQSLLLEDDQPGAEVSPCP